ncbi:hypothetical protein [Streptococcus agalactiae]|uniref:hypothetical protein n=1 Tax=Streptococcus agalactiae TaxID=1311 RepID=UPI00085C1A81|nr:hypothetical protein [Streptococcus agalactiae]
MAHTNFKVISILPAGSMLTDGTILTEETEFTEEEFKKNPLRLPTDHPVNQFLLRLSIEKWSGNV